MAGRRIEYTYDEKTENLKNHFEAKAGEKMVCTNRGCEQILDAEEMWENIKEIIQIDKENGHSHLFDNLKKRKNLLYYKCPSCGGGVFKGYERS